jgi:hypothetical protein
LNSAPFCTLQSASGRVFLFWDEEEQRTALHYGRYAPLEVERITEKKTEDTAVNRLGKTCIECNSGIIGKTEERELRQFRFERIEFACGATLESFHTANGNVGRAIHSGCTATG